MKRRPFSMPLCVAVLFTVVASVNEVARPAKTVAPVSGMQLAPIVTPCCADTSVATALLHCANTSARKVAGSFGGARVALLTMVTPGLEGYAAYAAGVNAAYAKTFGHTFTVVRGSSRTEAGNLWRAGNVAAILDWLEAAKDTEASWVVWLDADAILVDFGRADAIEAVIRDYATAASTSMLVCPGEIIGPGASSLFNSGFIALRRADWALKFVRHWWGELQMGSENDQEVLERLYRDNVLGARSRIVALPKGLMYSEIGDPIAKPAQEQHAIHLAGLPDEVRRSVFGHFFKALCVASGFDGITKSRPEGGHPILEAPLASDASPESSKLREVYLASLGHYVTKRSRSESLARGAESIEPIHIHGVCSIDPGRECLEAAERLSYGLRIDGRLSESSAWALGVLDVREKRLGSIHADTLASRERVAEVAEDRGDLDEAIKQLHLCVEGRMLVYGSPRHRAVQLANLRLGRLLRQLGRLAEAEQPSVGAKDVLVAILGPEHTASLAATANLAELRLQQRRPSEAANLYKAAAAAATRSLGKGHTTTLDMKQGVVDALLAAGQADKAVRLARGLVARRETAASDGPDLGLARALETYAAAIDFSGRGDVGETTSNRESNEVRRRAVDAYVVVLGGDAAKTLEVRNLYETRLAHSEALSAQTRGSVSEAEGWLRRALEFAPLGSALRGGISNNLGMLLRGRGLPAQAMGVVAKSPCVGEAEALLRGAIADFRNSLGADAVDTLRASGNLGDHMRDCGRLAEARPLLEAALVGIQKWRLLDPVDAAIARDALVAEGNLALMLYQDGLYADAESHYRNGLAVAEATFGVNSVEATNAREEMRTLLRLRGREQEAVTLHVGPMSPTSRQSEPNELTEPKKPSLVAPVWLVEGNISETRAKQLSWVDGITFVDVDIDAAFIMGKTYEEEGKVIAQKSKEGPKAQLGGPLESITFVDPDVDVDIDCDRSPLSDGANAESLQSNHSTKFNATVAAIRAAAAMPAFVAPLEPRGFDGDDHMDSINLEVLEDRVVFRARLPERLPKLRAATKLLRQIGFVERIYDGVFSYSSSKEWHSKIMLACKEDEPSLAPLHAEDQGTLTRLPPPDGTGVVFCELARVVKTLLTQRIFPKLGLGYDRRCSVWETFVNRQVAGGSVAPHVHLDDFFGAVYYLDAPDGTVLAYGNGEPSPAELSDAMLRRWTLRAPGAVVELPDEPRYLHPKPGDLFLFPVGWMKHWVPPITSKGYRTSIVLNTFCV